MPDFRYQETFPHGPDATPYRKLDGDWVGEDAFRGQRVLTIAPAALTRLAFEAVRDVSHLFRPGHLAQLRTILEDPEASANDRFVALNMLRNACVSAGMVLPSCQDTGTAIVIGKKGQRVWTGGDDEAALSRGVFDVYQQTSLRYSQMAPLSTFEERNTGTNLPAQLELYATGGDEYRFLFVTKGGGSANKSYLYQETPALLGRERLLAFLEEKVRTLGTAACPPYHLAVVIGGTSAEVTMKTVKLASTRPGTRSATPSSRTRSGR
jgi:fumarate hydratase class I